MNGFRENSLKDQLLDIWYQNKKIIFIVGVVVLLGLIVLIINACSNNSNTGISYNPDNEQYKSIESIMVLNAKDYIANNNIEVPKEGKYFSLDLLNLSLDDDLICSIQSGIKVIENNDNLEYIPYLMCDKYNSDVINDIIKENNEYKDIITLKGDNPYFTNGEHYSEPGYDLKNGYYVSVSNDGIENSVDEISYTILKNGKLIGTVTRIIVTEKFKYEEPSIELNGPEFLNILKGMKYTELGCTVIDKYDGNISDKVKITGNVDTTKGGKYTITYTVTNSKGVTSSTTRTVVVMDASIALSIDPSGPTNDSVNITINVSDDLFSHILLPDDSKTYNKTYSYKVTENGTYTFAVYNIKGVVKHESIEIKNIDRNIPSGSCSGYYKNGVSNITVKASDVSGIGKYVVEGKEYTSNNIIVNKELEKVSVTIYDKAGNNADISCELENKNKIYYYEAGLFKKQKLDGFQYTLFVPEGLDKSKKQPIVMALHGGGGRHCPNIDGKWLVDVSKSYPYTHHPLYSQIGNSVHPKMIIVMPEKDLCNWPGSEAEKAMNILRKIVNDYNGDPERISITGWSQGGAGSLYLLQKYPDYFSVGVITSPATNGTNGNPNVDFKTPLWLFASYNEYPLIYNYVNNLYAYLNSTGRTVKKNIMNTGHNTPQPIFRDSTMLDWMAKQKKGQPVVFDSKIEESLSQYLIK